MKKSISLFLLLFCLSELAFVIPVRAQEKYDLKVLIVAHNPEKVYTGAYSGPAPNARQQQLALTRGAEFKTLLDKFFTKVDLIGSDVYTAARSEGYDVTIMDDLPPAIDTIDYGLYAKGKSFDRGGRPLGLPRYIPEDFSGALIVLGEITDDLTYTMPTKFMTQCHCIIQGYACFYKKEHAIFNTPIKVELKEEKVKTPGNFTKYYSGVGIPPELDVLWMQTESNGDRKGYWVGQILVGMGFDDSPDCEFISSSNSLKDITGMALGRSGNIFHWGFSASPDFMTEQAKQIFVNTVCYMARFNGRRGITRFRSEARAWVNEFCYRKTGMLLDHASTEYKKCGDPEKDELYQFYKDNYPYFRLEGLTPEIDEDAKSLGIANYDVRLLDEAIKLLGSKDSARANKGYRLTRRYTEYDFPTVAGWRKWFKKYGKYLFFTEMGGYKFQVDTWNHPELKAELSKTADPYLQKSCVPVSKSLMHHGISRREEPAVDDIVDGSRDVIVGNVRNSPDDVVKVSGKVVMTGDNQATFELEVDIKEGWHIYAHVPEGSGFIQTGIEIERVDGVSLAGAMILPRAYDYESMEQVTIYKGKVVFRQQLSLDKKVLAGKSLTCSVSFQCCDDYSCQPPETKSVLFKF